MGPPSHSPVTTTPRIRTLLTRLHALSATQESAIEPSAIDAIKTQAKTDPTGAFAALDELMLDKFIALEEDKCHIMYNILLATGATTAVEIGTSFGVSTIYLALAVGRNVARRAAAGENVKGVVIGTEKEKEKAEVARTNWKEAGDDVERWIDLKVGDLNQTLQGDLGLGGKKVDFLLLDIWPHVALPGLNLILPHLRPGAVVLSDNTIASAERYGELLAVLRNPDGPFRSTTLPYSGGLEMSVYDP